MKQMKYSWLLSAAAVAAVALFPVATAHAAGQGRSAEIIAHSTLPPYSLESFGYTASELAVANGLGLTSTDRPAIGSGLEQVHGNWFLGITDRGPNLDHFPVNAFCVPTNTSSDGKVYPLPQFSPAIMLFQAVNDELVPEAIISLTGSDGVGITGLPNETSDEKAFESLCHTTPLTVNPSGMDVEDFHTLPNWKFIGVEEYRPSVFVGDLQTGRVLKRYTPQGKTLPGATYPVSDILPAVLKERRNNRGFESIPVSQDGQTAYAVTQSPLGSTSGSQPYGNTRVLRLFRLDVGDPLNVQVTGQFISLMSSSNSYPAGNRQRDLKLSSAAWVSRDKLLFLERSDESGIGGVRLILVDLTQATDVQDHPVANVAPTAANKLVPTFENINTVLSALDPPVIPAVSTVVFEEFETDANRLFPSYKLEGLTVLNANEVAISNDNDFGVGAIAGEPSMLWVLRLADKLPLGH